MADLEATLADISLIMTTQCPYPAQPIVLPDPSVQFVVESYISEHGLQTFDAVFDDLIGYQLFQKYVYEGGSLTFPFIALQSKKCIQLYEMICDYERLDNTAKRKPIAKKIYNTFIMPDLLEMNHPFGLGLAHKVRDAVANEETEATLFDEYKTALREYLVKNEYRTFKCSQHYTRYLQWKYIELNTKVGINDFEKFRIIGRGGFGEVYCHRKKDTGFMCAIKYLYKKKLIMKKTQKMPFEERNMLLKFDNPFIVCLSYTFQTEEKLCFVLDLMNGGDLRYQLRKRKTFTEDEAKFYAVEITLGLEHMHSKNVIYRDLKPGNILMDEHGHIKLSDLGLATDITHKLPTSPVGTPGYMSPEVNLRKPYGLTSDWFSFGCTVYYFLTGHVPYDAHDLSFSLPVPYPDDLSFDTVNLVQGLLKHRPDERLGYRGSAEIKSHPWFEDIDWTLASRLGLDPPIVPSKGEVHAADANDIGTFDDRDTRGITITKEDDECFKDFDMFFSNRWQREILESSPNSRPPKSCFDISNEHADKIESKRRNSSFFCMSQARQRGDSVIQGYLERLGGMILTKWQKKYFILYSNRLDMKSDQTSDTVLNSTYLDNIMYTGVCSYSSSEFCIRIEVLAEGKAKRSSKSIDFLLLKCETELEVNQWFKHLNNAIEQFKVKCEKDKVTILSDSTTVEGDWALVDPRDEE